jgi:hypothetical protein
MAMGILTEIRPYGRENYVSKLDPTIKSVNEENKVYAGIIRIYLPVSYSSIKC